LRFGDAESHIDVNFECGASPLKRVDVPGFQNIRLETLTGGIAKTTTGLVSVPANVSALCINYKGTFIAPRTGSQGRLILVPPRSVTYIRGGTRLIVQAARGEHSSQVLTWPSAMTPLLEHFVNTTNAKGSSNHRSVACKPIDPHFVTGLQRFEEAKQAPEYGEPLMLSVIYEVIAKLVVGSDEVQLAAIPAGLPETIRNLTERVRKSPAGGWPLKEAADAAGYSPFHFSRVFKQMVGYGFHEYVDRCRTETAVEMLVTTDNPVDLVASSCGFGTTQGLRESVKEYLGLVPSELRNPAEPYEPRD